MSGLPAIREPNVFAGVLAQRLVNEGITGDSSVSYDIEFRFQKCLAEFCDEIVVVSNQDTSADG